MSKLNDRKLCAPLEGLGFRSPTCLRWSRIASKINYITRLNFVRPNARKTGNEEIIVTKVPS